MRNLKKMIQMNLFEQSRNRLTDLENKLTVSKLMVSDIVGCWIWVSQSLHLSTRGQGQGPSGPRVGSACCKRAGSTAVGS